MSQEEVPPSPPKKGKMIIILILAAGLLLSAGGSLTYFLIGENSQVQGEMGLEEKPENLESIYVNLNQPFIFNAPGDIRQRLVQIDVQLIVKGAENEALAKQNLPMIESSLLTTFGAATVEQLRRKDGLIELRKQALANLQQAMEKIEEKPVVSKVLFTGFVMQ